MTKTDDRPVYIALEGPDGVGKSSTAQALAARLAALPDRPCVRVRHFPTDALVDAAHADGRRPTAEDYLKDMENWLAFGSAPVAFPDTPAYTPTALHDATRIYVLDRWVLSTGVYAHLRNERIPPRLRPTAEWLAQIPLITFVLMPKEDQASLLTDPDYPDPAGYDPLETTEAYRRFLEGVFFDGPLDVYSPIAVDRAFDTPQKTAYTIVGWLGANPAAAND